MPIFTRKKDKLKKIDPASTNGNTSTRPKWEDSWLRTRVDAEEVAELLRGCTQEVKSRGLDVPFLLLPFRPSSDPSAAKTFVRNYFYPPIDRQRLTEDVLMKELKMTDVMVLIAVMKWCWARLPGGVVSWEVYQGFKVGEKDSGYVRNAFKTFVPLSIESKARVQIINDFFDLMAALAAHGKSNGLGGHKLSRYAGWWAFEHYDTGKGFDAGYRQWTNAANATSHLFFAYLRSSTPDPSSTNGILSLPRSLQQLLDSIDYPPRTTYIANNTTTKVVMIVDVVSPTPFALLRRAKNFEYRDSDVALRRFAEFHDPIDALSEECRRVLKAISSTNQSQVSDAKTSTSLKDPSWSRFEDIGFGSAFDETAEDGMYAQLSPASPRGLSTISRSRNTDLNRPTTPSWADFLSSGFTDENGNKASVPALLPPDKALPPMGSLPRGQSSQSHRREVDNTRLEPGELASIANFDLDDSFWWVWITSLAGEEPVARKAAFGRCALIETKLLGGQWMVMEEQVKGAAPEPTPGAYVAERKSFFSFTKKGRLTRRRSALKKNIPEEPKSYDPSNRLTLDQDRQAKIQKAAAELARQKQLEEAQMYSPKRGRMDENTDSKTTSVFTLGALIKDEASPALQWAKQYDKKAIQDQYLGKHLGAKDSTDLLYVPSTTTLSMRRSASTLSFNKDLPPAPHDNEKILVEPTVVAHPALQARSEEVVKNMPVTPEIIHEKPAQPLAPPPPPPVPVQETPRAELQATNETPIPSAPVVVATDIAPAKQSTESKRSFLSNRSEKEKATSEKNRVKKLGFNAPPPVSTNKVSGIRKMFGTLRKKDYETTHLSPDSPTNEPPAIAAARRALEGKPAKPTDGPVSPPLSPNHFAKFQNAASVAAASTPETNGHEPAIEAVSRSNTDDVYELETPPEIASSKPDVGQSIHDQVTQSVVPHHSAPLVESIPEPNGISHEARLSGALPVSAIGGQAHVERHEIDSGAKDHSRFDQGPLTEQPAFVANGHMHDTDSEADAAPAFEPPLRQQRQSVYSNMTLQTDATEEDPTQPSFTTTAAHDRWAQIRKNAAERAAMATEDPQGRTGNKTTDDVETSGEETIESRVARIKARVAELTGNMEAARR